LPRPVELLQGAWEVVLCEFIYPISVSETQLQPVFAYCDMIGPQMVGDTLARCLLTVLYPYPDGYHIFDKAYYVPVEKSEFQTVTIDVLTKLGDRVTFADSVNPLVAVHHF
jgi:hypothetical protein